VTTHVPLPASQELLEELRRLCAEVVEIPIGKITDEADLAADLGVDSLTQDELVVTALERYGLSDMASTIRPTSYPTLRDLADLIQQLSGAKSSGPDD
jgi:[acyl-carrier-protein] S-malonyltransferase